MPNTTSLPGTQGKNTGHRDPSQYDLLAHQRANSQLFVQTVEEVRGLGCHLWSSPTADKHRTPSKHKGRADHGGMIQLH